MPTEDEKQRLSAAWGPARRRGVLGSASTSEICEHAAGFIPAAWRVEGQLWADVGSGAGVPGVVLALDHPTTRWHLIDSSERRCLLAMAVVRAMEIGDRVEVCHGRVEEFAGTDWARGSFDGATARLLGRPAEVAECVAPLIRVGGRLVASVDDAGWSWWQAADLRRTGLGDVDGWSSGRARYVGVEKVSEGDPALPRRKAARARDPLG